MMQLDLHDIREQTLIQWMEQYGDVILRTCYLLCGDIKKARAAAQRVFILAYGQMAREFEPQKTPLHVLLQFTLEDCPCRPCTGANHFPDSAVAKLLRLSPSNRKAAILCLYHALSIHDAADILHTSEQAVRRRLSCAQRMMA